MDEIEQRLRESTEALIKGFENWLKNAKNLESREQLMDAMHETRKVISRVEIEIALSERDRLGSRPLPIPPHRSSRRPSSDNGDDGDADFNAIDDGDDAQPDENSGAGQGGGARRGGGGRGGRRSGGSSRSNNNNNGNA